MKKSFKYIFLFIGPFLFFLLICELLTRVLWASPKFKYPQTLHQKHAVLGWEQIPNQRAYTWDAIPVQINSHGLRDDEFLMEKGKNVFRVLVLGDSVTFGTSVAGDKTYSNQLEKLLNNNFLHKKFEVINAGVQRYFTYQELDYLKLKGLQFQSDLVIIGFYINDFGIRPVTWTRDYENTREKKMNTLWEKVPFIASMIKNSAFVEFVKQRYRRLKQVQSRNKSTQTKLLEGIQDAKMMSLWNAATEYLTEFKNLSKKHGFELLLVAIPGRNQVLREYPESSYPKKLKEIADELGIAYLEMLSTFRENYTGDIRSLYFRYDGHPNAVAHGLIAKKIFMRLQKDNLIP